LDDFIKENNTDWSKYLGISTDGALEAVAEELFVQKLCHQKQNVFTAGYTRNH
jgi:hypothetical protein